MQSSSSALREDLNKLRWKTCSSSLRLPTPRQGFGCATDGRKWILVAGGYDEGKALNTAVIINVETNQVMELPPMLHHRGGCAASYIGADGKFVVVGGKDRSGNVLASAEEWNGQQWSEMALKMKTPRFHCSVINLNDTLFVIGGLNQYFKPAAVKDEVYDFAAHEGWKELAGIGDGQVALEVVDGKISAFGGYLHPEAVRVYDASTDKWTFQKQSLTLKRRSAAACAMVNSKVLLVGGTNSMEGKLESVGSMELGSPDQSFQLLDDATTLKTRRWLFGSALVGFKLYILGGCLGTRTLDSIEVLDLSSILAKPSPVDIPKPPSQLDRHELLDALRKWVIDGEKAVDAHRESVRDWRNAEKAKCEEYVSGLRRKIDGMKAQMDGMETLIRHRKNEAKQKIERVDKETAGWIARQESQLAVARTTISSLSFGSSTPAKRGAPPRSKMRTGLGTPPQELTCPITLELMKDPVVAADGHTYERSAIEKIFQRRNGGGPPRSPCTNLALTSETLIPNVLVRSMCRKWEKDLERGN